MAVPAWANFEEEEEEYEGLFEEVEGLSDLDGQIPPHRRALADAAFRGDIEALRIALDNHTGTINDPVEDGDTLLHLCCLYGYLPCVRLLLERGADLQTKDEEGAIPLHDACAGGFVEIVQYIINSARHADFVKQMLETTDAEGDTPLHHAARGEHLNVVHLLLSAGASPKMTNVYGMNPAGLAESDPIRSTLEAAAATDSIFSG